MADGAALYFETDIDFSGISAIVAFNYIVPEMETILKKHIDKDIYGAYGPKQYKRRMSLNKDFEAKIIDNNTIFVTNNAYPNKPARGRNGAWHAYHDGAFLEMLAGSNLGFWYEGFPRPAVANAQQEIDSSYKIKSAIAHAQRDLRR